MCVKVYIYAQSVDGIYSGSKSWKTWKKILEEITVRIVYVWLNFSIWLCCFKDVVINYKWGGGIIGGKLGLYEPLVDFGSP